MSRKEARHCRTQKVLSTIMHVTRRIACLVCVAGLLQNMALATDPTAPMTLTVTTTSHGYQIPADFSGLSFETGSELSGQNGTVGNFFSPTNSQLITLFQNIGLKNLRVGGGSVNDYTPSNSDIDALFQFAPQAGVKVIYSVPLYNACASCDASTAAYIYSKNYQGSLHSFSIGNEQDWKSFLYPPTGTGTDPNLSDLPSYITDWTNFANTILGSVPGAVFSGPDTGAYDNGTYFTGTSCGTSYPNGVSWTQGVADCKKNSGIPKIVADFQHYYVGHSPGTETTQQAIDNMLSSAWVTNTQMDPTEPGGVGVYTPYPWLYQNNLAPVVADGLPYRLTESNDVLTGVSGASDGYAAALWALDYMSWWAAHNAAGVNFHNKQWIITDTIVPNPNPCPLNDNGDPVCGDYQTTAKGYGIKAFNMGGHGYVEPISISNPNGINVTAYSVGEGQDLYVTIINKTHLSTNDVTDAVVTIQPNGFTAASAAWVALSNGAPGNASSMTATLGGASIANNARWLGRWTTLSPDSAGSGVTLTVPSTSAAVVKIHAASAYAGPIQIDENGALEMFGSDISGNIWHSWQKAANVPNSPLTNWSSWTELPGTVSSGGTAVVKNADNTLEVFIPTAGDVYHNYQLTPNGSWSGWIDMGTSSNGVTNLQAANNADGSLSVFGIGTNGDVWYASQNAPGVGWSSWADLSGQNIQSGFVVGQNLAGYLEVFGVDKSGNVWHNWQTTSGAWSGWNSLSGKSVDPHLAIARNLDGRLEVFGLDPNGYVWHNWQTSPGGAWNGWSEITGNQLRPGFVVGQNKDGRLVLFGAALASPYDVWNIWQQGVGSNFGGNWTDMGGAGMDPKLVVSNTADGRMQLFGIGTNKDVWSDWQPSTGGWNGWADFGGNGMTFYPGQP